MVIFDNSALSALEKHLSKAIYYHFDRRVSKANCRDFAAKLAGYKNHGHLISKLKEGPVFAINSTYTHEANAVFDEFYSKHKLHDDDLCSFREYVGCLYDTTIPEMIPTPKVLLDMQGQHNAIQDFTSATDIKSALEASGWVNEIYFCRNDDHIDGEFDHLPEDELNSWIEGFGPNHDYFHEVVIEHYKHCHPDKPLYELVDWDELDNNPDYQPPINSFYNEHIAFFNRFSNQLKVESFSSSEAIRLGALNGFFLRNPGDLGRFSCGLNTEKLTNLLPSNALIAAWWVWLPYSAWGFDQSPEEGCGEQVIYLASYSPETNKWAPIGYTQAEQATAGIYASTSDLFEVMDASSARSADTFKAIAKYRQEHRDLDKWLQDETCEGEKVTLFLSTTNLLKPEDDEITAIIACQHLGEFCYSFIEAYEEEEPEFGVAKTFNGDRFPKLAMSFIGACMVAGPEPIEKIIMIEHRSTSYTVPAESRRPTTPEVEKEQEKQKSIACAIDLAVNMSRRPIPIITYDPWDYPIT